MSVFFWLFLLLDYVVYAFNIDPLSLCFSLCLLVSCVLINFMRSYPGEHSLCSSLCLLVSCVLINFTRSYLVIKKI